MSTASFILTLAVLPVSFAVWTAVCLAQNYAKARTAGLPIVLRFINPGGVFWMMFSPLVIRILSYLPFTDSFIAIYRRGWEARERCRPHVALGDLFIICTPGGNWLKVCNEVITNDVLKRKEEFGRNMEAYEVLNIYGKNLATTEGADWNRHRKVAAASFTEKNNELVWRESLKEGEQMLEYWLHRAPSPIRTLAEDTRVFTLNVLAAALFDKSYPFESGAESKLRQASGQKDEAFEYRDSLSTILQTIIPILVFGEKKLKEAFWLPASFRKAGRAVTDFRTFVLKLIDTERELKAQGERSSPNLVTNLVRACEEEDNGSSKDTYSTPDSSKPRRAILTKDEIVSDLFIFAFAGNDTTAITLTFILAELAAHPEVQDWLSEELRHYLSDTNTSQWDYATCAKLKRCWSVVYETLRISHPLNQLQKTTGSIPRTIRFEGRDIIIPAKTNIEINLPALQTHPRHWGADSLIWNPKRFITSDSSAIESEILPPDTSSTFLPWSYGKNVCPGKRFSQVELVAALAVLFKDYRLEPIAEMGESLDEARSRVGRLAEFAEFKFLIEMSEPEKVGVQWIRRES